MFSNCVRSKCSLREHSKVQSSKRPAKIDTGNSTCRLAGAAILARCIPFVSKYALELHSRVRLALPYREQGTPSIRDRSA